MSWRDREYWSEAYGERAVGAWRARAPRGVTLILMIVHAAAFVLMLMLAAGPGQSILALMTLTGKSAHPLGIVLHPFATTNVLSALFTVLAVWSLGGRLESRLGTGQLVALYIIGDLLAGTAYYGVARWWGVLATAPLEYPVGALAGWCVAAARSLRYETVAVFGRTTSAGKVYAVCGLIVVALAVAHDGFGALAWLVAAALGGITGLLPGHWPSVGWLHWRRMRRRVRPSIPARPRPEPDEPDIDDILEKISRRGMGSLTSAERQRLEKARLAKLRRARHESDKVTK